MPSCRVTFMLPFDNSDEEDGYDSDFENTYEPKEEAELDLNKEILLFKDDNLDSDSKLEEGTSFVNIEEYLAEMALVEPPELPPAKIPILTSDRPVPTSKLRVLPNNGIKIQALTLLQEQMPV
jgi:hypothetical protein